LHSNQEKRKKTCNASGRENPLLNGRINANCILALPYIEYLVAGNIQ